jgi:hypothetical protein
MPARNNATKRLHTAAAALLLAVVAASMVATLSPSEIARRGQLLWRSLAGETITATERTGFWFDPAYGDFLDEVRRRTPKDATIAIVVPSWPDVYVYQAAYQLAPRRVVERGRENEATFVAAYPYQAANGMNPEATAIGGGALFHRR